jgi:hypothetical protein
MSIDTREKRASVPGVGRPWMRDKLPGTADAAWRRASGNAYSGNAIAGTLSVQMLCVSAEQVYQSGLKTEEVYQSGLTAEQAGC